ncbi:O-methyltransferase [Reichenbachiella sp.]|uniref:O-methyltransferase n=1 Tax=Reichenbachiella sp. TaxID=2184521 RepID=UPI003BAF0CFA
MNSPEVEAIRHRLLSDSREIQMNRFGSGSSLSAPRSKQVKIIAQAGISNRKQSEILFNLLEYQSCKVVLELGTSLGLNTIYMSEPSCVERVVTIDGNAELCKIAKEHFSELELKNVEHINSDIDTYLLQTNQTFDFVYIDANHTYEATMRYFSMTLGHLSNSGTIVIDDINWSPEMSKAWLEIQHDYPEYLYVENDKIGIVFVNVESVKGHYILSF